MGDFSRDVIVLAALLCADALSRGDVAEAQKQSERAFKVAQVWHG